MKNTTKITEKIRGCEPDYWAGLINLTDFTVAEKCWAASVVWSNYYNPPSSGLLSEMVDDCPRVRHMSVDRLEDCLAAVGLANQ